MAKNQNAILGANMGVPSTRFYYVNRANGTISPYRETEGPSV